jgi:hypothetical protein
MTTGASFTLGLESQNRKNDIFATHPIII